MRKIPVIVSVALLVSAAALLAAAPARAESAPARGESGFGIGINVSNLGFGVEGRQVLSPSFDLRFGIAGIAYHTDFDYDDINYDIKQSTAVPEVKLDWRPMQGMFRLTFGLAYYNQVSNLELTPEPGGTYNIGNGSYTSAQIGTLAGKVSHHVGAPYFGVGWDFLKNKNLGFTIDAGAYYRNKPDAWLSSTGTVTAADLALEAQNIEDDALTFVPVVKLGLLFRF